MNLFEEGGNDRDQEASNIQELVKANDPLQGIGAPMTRSRTKQMKEALQGLIMELQEQEMGQHNSNTSPKLINILYQSGDEVEDISILPTIGLYFSAARI